MEPLLAQAASLRIKVVGLKENLKRLKKSRADDAAIEALESQIWRIDREARDLEGQATSIDAAVFDLKAVNPNAVAKIDDRTPAEIIQNIADQGRIVSDALARLRALLT